MAHNKKLYSMIWELLAALRVPNWCKDKHYEGTVANYIIIVLGYCSCSKKDLGLDYWEPTVLSSCQHLFPSYLKCL